METDFETLPTGEDAPRVVNAVIEVPAGSRNKYEYEPELKAVVLDRVLPANIRFPGNYGFVPSTVGADGEPLDILVAAYDPVFPGCVVKARIIGALEMAEEGGPEHNIFAVPEGDAHFDTIETLDDLPEQSLREVEQFFVAYKRLEGDEEAEVKSWRGYEEAQEIIREATR